MKAIIICHSNDEYYGIYQLNCLAEYIDNKKLKDDVESFINNYLDEETQLIKYTPYSLYDAVQLSDKITNKFDDTQVIIFSDTDEDIDESTAEFIGYDICADDYYTSVIGLGYLGEVDGYTKDEDEYFFDNLSNEVRYEYFEQLNEYGIFDEISPANELADYCNWLKSEYEDDDNVLQGANNFKVVKIYLPK
jgi:hypothetical protein